MEVVLQEDFPSLGYVGDKVRVRGGFARNYLLPRGIAVEASSANAKYLRHKLSQIEAKKAKLKAVAVEEAKKYTGLTLEFTLKIGEKGKSFGAVSVKDIEQSLKAKGLEVDRKQLRLVDQIKAGGEYKVDIKLHSEVIVPVAIKVTIERQEKKAAKGDEEAKAKRGRGRKRTKSQDEGSEENEEVASAESSDSSIN
jgi:large subunit ribosomal protein L9